MNMKMPLPEVFCYDGAMNNEKLGLFITERDQICELEIY